MNPAPDVPSSRRSSLLTISWSTEMLSSVKTSCKLAISASLERSSGREAPALDKSRRPKDRAALRSCLQLRKVFMGADALGKLVFIKFPKKTFLNCKHDRSSVRMRLFGLVHK